MSAPKIPRVQPYEPDDPHQKIGSLEMGEIEICCSPVKMKLFSILLTPFLSQTVSDIGWVALLSDDDMGE